LAPLFKALGGMDNPLAQIPKWWLVVGALALPLLVTWAVTQGIYSSGKIASFQGWFFPGIGVGVALGAWCVGSLKIKSKAIKWLTVLVYCPLILSAAWVVGFFTACANGDCI